MKERPIIFSSPMIKAILEGRKSMTRRLVKFKPYADEKFGVYPHECPYGIPGDHLWVRETWECVSMSHYTPINGDESVNYSISYKPDGRFPNCKSFSMGKPVDNAWQKNRDGWRPSIHMPRWASRITLEITNIRVEKLQKITEEDAWKEGIVPLQMDMGNPLPRFEGLWDSIYGDGAWEKNPWVFVISFNRLD